MVEGVTLTGNEGAGLDRLRTTRWRRPFITSFLGIRVTRCALRHFAQRAELSHSVPPSSSSCGPTTGLLPPRAPLCLPVRQHGSSLIHSQRRVAPRCDEPTDSQSARSPAVSGAPIGRERRVALAAAQSRAGRECRRRSQPRRGRHGRRWVSGGSCPRRGVRASPRHSSARPSPAVGRGPRLLGAASPTGGEEGAVFRPGHGPGNRGPPGPGRPSSGAKGKAVAAWRRGWLAQAGAGRRVPPALPSPGAAIVPRKLRALPPDRVCPGVEPERGAVTGLVSLCPAPHEGSRGEKAACG